MRFENSVGSILILPDQLTGLESLHDAIGPVSDTIVKGSGSKGDESDVVKKEPKRDKSVFVGTKVGIQRRRDCGSSEGK